MELIKDSRNKEVLKVIKKCPRAGSNHGPYDLQSYALPAELQGQSISKDVKTNKGGFVLRDCNLSFLIYTFLLH